MPDQILSSEHKNDLRQEILARVRDFYAEKNKPIFQPGESVLSYAGRVYNEDEMVHLVDASLDFWLTSGRFSDQFEKEFAGFLGARFCALVNSGSSANLVAVSALTSPLLGDRRLKPGDEVITTACGFPATLNPILQNRLVPVFIDVHPGTYNIITEQIEKAVTKKTKAIFIAHTLGNPADLGVLTKLAKRYGLWLIEDNCDALGSQYKGQYTGSFGDISTCSFYPAHHITMGEGGAVVTNNAKLNKIILSFRDWGRDCWCKSGKDNTCGKRFKQKHGDLPFGYDHKYVYSHIGYNLKATDMQAAVGCAQLKKLPGFIAARKSNFRYLYESIKDFEKYFVLPAATENSDPSWFGFPILVKKSAPFSRHEIVEYLEANKIATRMLFGGNLIRQPAYQGCKYKVSGKLIHTDLVMNDLFWIGVYPGLTGEMLRYMAGHLKTFVEKFS